MILDENTKGANVIAQTKHHSSNWHDYVIIITNQPQGWEKIADLNNNNIHYITKLMASIRCISWERNSP